MTREEHLVTDELQFGFKKATGCQCPQAVFTLQSVVEYVNVRGSSVFAAALDIITKAFDTAVIDNFIRLSVA